MSASRRYVAARGCLLSAIRALPEEFQSGCVHDTREHVKSAIKASLDDVPILLAEVAALRSALERTQANFIFAVNGHPVRDMAENLAENAAAFGLRS